MGNPQGAAISDGKVRSSRAKHSRRSTRPLQHVGYRAGAVGFEPTGVLSPLVFKTSAFVRSAIPPSAHYTTPGISWEILGSGSSSEGKELLREPLWVVVGGV